MRRAGQRRDLLARGHSSGLLAVLCLLTCHRWRHVEVEFSFVPGLAARREAILAVAVVMVSPALPASAAADAKGAMQQVVKANEMLRDLQGEACWEGDDTKCGPVVKTYLAAGSPIYESVKGGLQQVGLSGLPEVGQIDAQFVDLDRQADYWIGGEAKYGQYWEQAGVNARRSLGQLIDSFEDAAEVILKSDMYHRHAS
ncbi:unnamed protein product [Polarella glacialis]|uniref:Uncharacterized protein n=1 Tax=Polarella glacialis TaxID=89957 RepID=A0A813D2V1_POLGL|nr:unnamed protein product [Polarella glacialis]